MKKLLSLILFVGSVLVASAQYTPTAIPTTALSGYLVSAGQTSNNVVNLDCSRNLSYLAVEWRVTGGTNNTMTFDSTAGGGYWQTNAFSISGTNALGSPMTIVTNIPVNGLYAIRANISSAGTINQTNTLTYCIKY